MHNRPPTSCVQWKHKKLKSTNWGPTKEAWLPFCCNFGNVKIFADQRPRSQNTHCDQTWFVFRVKVYDAIWDGAAPQIGRVPIDYNLQSSPPCTYLHIRYETLLYPERAIRHLLQKGAFFVESPRHIDG